MISRHIRAAATTAAVLVSAVAAQTYSSCNPLTSTSCPADTALGMAINVDFTKGAVNSFVASGGSPTYGADGVTFTVAKGGDAPQLTSVFYIMFGRVEVTMKCAPGAGIVSSLVLESDDLDEIDFEWLGYDAATVQTNYFGKGQTGAYDRGQFNPAPNNQAQFVTYTVDWTADRIQWIVGGTVVRTLTYNDANGQYPQTPMQIKLGAWSGGDPSNAQGTIDWAHGPTDYSKGPFSMSVKNAVITDYSTGKQYKYGDTSGSWQSIQAVDGQVGVNAGKAPAATATAAAAGATSLSPSVPVGGIGQGSTSTQTGWPWVASASASASAVGGSTSNPIPSGWTMTSEGKIVPSSSTVNLPPPSSSAPAVPSSSSQLQPAAGGEETITTWDGRGFLTTMTVPAGWTTMVKSYNEQGFLITPTPAANAAAAVATEAPPVAQADTSVGNAKLGVKVASNDATSSNRLPRWTPLQALLALATSLRLLL